MSENRQLLSLVFLVHRLLLTAHRRLDSWIVKKNIPNYIPFFTHLVFNLNSNLHIEKFQLILFFFFFFLAFNEISTNSNSSHLGWRMEGGHIVTHNFESGSTKDHFSFWKEDFNVIYFLIKCIQYKLADFFLFVYYIIINEKQRQIQIWENLSYDMHIQFYTDKRHLIYLKKNINCKDSFFITLFCVLGVVYKPF